MERRKAMALTATIIGGTIVGSEFLLSSCSEKKKKKAPFSETDLALLDEIGETVLPTNDRSPGAKAAKVGIFMKTMVNDCYSQKEKEIFINGIGEFIKLVKETYSKGFMELNKEQRCDLLIRLDNDAESFPEKKVTQFFQMVKKLTIDGYFTSEPGLTKALRYDQTPGKYIGCVPYIKGQGYIWG